MDNKHPLLHVLNKTTIPVLLWENLFPLKPENNLNPFRCLQGQLGCGFPLALCVKNPVKGTMTASVCPLVFLLGSTLKSHDTSAT